MWLGCWEKLDDLIVRSIRARLLIVTTEYMHLSSTTRNVPRDRRSSCHGKMADVLTSSQSATIAPDFFRIFLSFPSSVTTQLPSYRAGSHAHRSSEMTRLPTPHSVLDSYQYVLSQVPSNLVRTVRYICTGGPWTVYQKVFFIILLVPLTIAYFLVSLHSLSLPCRQMAQNN